MWPVCSLLTLDPLNPLNNMSDPKLAKHLISDAFLPLWPHSVFKTTLDSLDASKSHDKWPACGI